LKVRLLQRTAFARERGEKHMGAGKGIERKKRGEDTAS